MRRAALMVAVWLSVGLLALPTESRHAAAPPFFFMQLADPQFGMFTADADVQQETANFRFAIAAANRLRPAFVIVTGDLVNKAGDRTQIAAYRRVAAELDRSIPLYNVAGNHDVGNIPTPASIAAYETRFGPDHYVFRFRGLVGIVLDSCLISAPEGAPALFAGQEQWLRRELQGARDAGARDIVVFQHHPWFVHDPEEPDQYDNIPRERRARYLAWFREAGVKCLIAGHYHRNAVAHDGDMEMITSGPVGKPLGDGKSVLRILTVDERGITHRYYDFGEVPNRIALQK